MPSHLVGEQAGRADPECAHVRPAGAGCQRPGVQRLLDASRAFQRETLRHQLATIITQLTTTVRVGEQRRKDLDQSARTADPVALADAVPALPEKGRHAVGSQQLEEAALALDHQRLAKS